MSRSVNDNENVTSVTSITMNNVNDIDRLDNKYRRSRHVERLADTMVQKFGNSQYRSFYCKVAWKLSEARIMHNMEQAMRGDVPARLFTYLCKRDGV